MFDYTKDVVLNTVALSGEKQNVVTLAADAQKGIKAAVVIKGHGNYIKENIKNGKVCAGTEGALGQYTISLGTVDADANIRVSFLIKSLDQQYVDFALANFAIPARPVMVEFLATATPAQALADALNATQASDYKLFTAKVSGEDVVLTLAEKHMFIEKVEKGKEDVAVDIEKYDVAECDSCVGTYYKLAGASAVETTAPEAELFTSKWITENLRFPTYAHLRYESPTADELPIPGRLYYLVTFQYEVERDLGGLSAAGQKITSVTTHNFYVPSNLAGNLAQALGIPTE